ncbi:phage tail spike protein [Metabacillus halosaccharovorans]|uniref:phage tail spike protein n=1 Tax=Metabacillus halosaccharovorans TaxID=930124 RepID=UPI0009959948|nr:phage tail spike protein [Metabacillus halosaccharovorans]
MSDLLLFDDNDDLLAVLSNEPDQDEEHAACPFWNAPFKEELNRGSTFEFNVPATHEDSVHVKEDNQVAFMDKDGYFRLFIIRETESVDGEEGAEIHAICEPSFMELVDEPLEDVRPYDTTAEDALDRALINTRWQRGTVAPLGINSTNYYYISVKDAIEKILNTWGGELRDRIEILDNEIVGRYIDILPRRGADTGKRWEIDKDIIAISRNKKSYVKTALYGRGKSLETEDGGYTRKITFADVEWSVANGDPVDKPLGQEWVGDPKALSQFGYKNSDGSRRHRFGFYENGDIEDPEELLLDTWNNLQIQSKQFANYTIDGLLLENIDGYEFEKVSLGDTNIAIDRNFAEPIEVELRIISYEYDVSNPHDVGKVEMGQFIELYDEEREIEAIKAKINDKEGIWESGGDSGPIDGSDFPDIIPDVPTLTASGLFQTVLLDWTFQSELYVAEYELYASQLSNFTPDPSNLIYRGKSSGYTHSVDTNQQWYYKVRGVNTHGNASDFSLEASAQTARIITDEIMFGAITNDLLADLAVDASKLADLAVTESKIGSGAVTNGKLADLAVNANKLANGSITEVKVGNSAITTGKLADLAVIAEKMANGSVINSKLGNLAVDASKIANGAVNNDKLDDLAVTAQKIADGAVTELKVGSGAITNSRLADLAVDALKLANGAVTEGKIGSGAVTETKLGSGAVTNGKLADLAVNASKLASGAVTETKLGSNAVTNAKLADLAVDAEKLANSAVTSTKIANLAVGTAAIQNLAVTNGKIDDLAVTSAKIANLAVGNAAIANGAITEAKIQNLAVTSAKIDDLAVVNGKIANLAVGTGAIQDLAVTGAKIANLGVTNAKIDNGAITEAKIAKLAVGTGAIQNLAVTGAKIANATITNAQIDFISADVIYTSSSNVMPPGWDTLDQFGLGVQPPGQSGNNSICEITQDHAYIGRYSLKTLNSAANSYKYIETSNGFVDAKPGERWIASVYALRPYDTTASLVISLVFRDSSGNALTSTYGSKTIDQNNSWTRLYSAATAPANTAKVSVYIRTQDSEARTVYWDAFQLEKVEDVTQTIPTPFRPTGSTIIHGGNIVADSVTADQMAANSVTASNGAIANLAVTNAKIADTAITSAKIANLAVGNAAIANGAITEAKIGNLEVTTGKIDDLAITSAKIASLAVGTGAIANLAVTNAKIGNLAVGTAQIASSAITNAKIANLAVDSAKIADLAITNAKIANGTITNAKIANLDASKITTGILKAIDIEGVTITGSTIQSIVGNSSTTIQGAEFTSVYTYTDGTKDQSLISSGEFLHQRYRKNASNVNYLYSEFELGRYGFAFKSRGGFAFSEDGIFMDSWADENDLSHQQLNFVSGGVERLGFACDEENDFMLMTSDASRVTVAGAAEWLISPSGGVRIPNMNGPIKIKNVDGHANLTITNQSDQSAGIIRSGANRDFEVYAQFGKMTLSAEGSSAPLNLVSKYGDINLTPYDYSPNVGLGAINLNGITNLNDDVTINSSSFRQYLDPSTFGGIEIISQSSGYDPTISLTAPGGTWTVRNDDSVNNIYEWRWDNVRKAYINTNGDIVASRNLISSGGVEGTLKHISGYARVYPYSSQYDDGSYGRFFYDGTNKELEFSARKDSPVATYGVALIASAFRNNSSALLKTNITDLTDEEALMLLDSVNISKYHMISDVESGVYDKPRIGGIAEMMPAPISNGSNVDTYSMISTLWHVVKIQKREIEELKEKYNDVIEVLGQIA